MNKIEKIKIIIKLKIKIILSKERIKDIIGTILEQC